MKFEAELDGRVLPIEVQGEAGRYRIGLEGETVDVDARRVGEGLWSLVIGAVSLVADITEEDGVSVVHVDGETYRIRVEEETRYLIRTRGGAAAATGQVLRAPMPGRVVLIEVAVGQRVQRGDGLVILEAMKMENEFRASGEGTVKEIRVETGQAVNPGDVLMVIE
jgi:acetyl/propionyl-CoA carboxylase alpha subunit